MIIQEIIYYIREDVIEEYLTHFEQLANYTRCLNGVDMHVLHKDGSESNKFYLYTKFTSRKVAENWFSSAERKHYLESAQHCFQELLSFNRYSVSSLEDMS